GGGREDGDVEAVGGGGEDVLDDPGTGHPGADDHHRRATKLDHGERTPRGEGISTGFRCGVRARTITSWRTGLAAGAAGTVDTGRYGRRTFGRLPNGSRGGSPGVRGAARGRRSAGQEGARNSAEGGLLHPAAPHRGTRAVRGQHAPSSTPEPPGAEGAHTGEDSQVSKSEKHPPPEQAPAPSPPKRSH